MQNSKFGGRGQGKHFSCHAGYYRGYLHKKTTIHLSQISHIKTHFSLDMYTVLWYHITMDEENRPVHNREPTQRKVYGKEEKDE